MSKNWCHKKGVETRVGAQAKTDEKTCENCPLEGKVMSMVRRCSRWSEVLDRTILNAARLEHQTTTGGEQ
jgi:hypothetical protein